MTNKCEVENCNGTYESTVISYTQIRLRKQITVEEYNSLESKKGYFAVISEHCNICNDDLEKRLVNFIQQNSHKLIKG